MLASILQLPFRDFLHTVTVCYVCASVTSMAAEWPRIYGSAGMNALSVQRVT